MSAPLVVTFVAIISSRLHDTPQQLTRATHTITTYLLNPSALTIYFQYDPTCWLAVVELNLTLIWPRTQVRSLAMCHRCLIAVLLARTCVACYGLSCRQLVTSAVSTTLAGGLCLINTSAHGRGWWQGWALMCRIVIDNITDNTLRISLHTCTRAGVRWAHHAFECRQTRRHWCR